MTAQALETAPVLSTPDTHIFEDPTPPIDPSSIPRLSDEQVHITYEIARTVKEIKASRWKRIALQFPDHMLVDAPRVYEALSRGLKSGQKHQNGSATSGEQGNGSHSPSTKLENMSIQSKEDEQERLFILGDTSYGACCVDEVAAEHVDADVVVHYGRSCLSPPSRLPVIYVFTERTLDLEAVKATFESTFQDKQQRIILMADVPYSHHVRPLQQLLETDGYAHIFATELVHNPSSPLPNRTTPPDTKDSEDALREYSLFHISDPPTSLLLTLSSRVSSTYIYPTTPFSVLSTATKHAPALLASTSQTLRRRYALLTQLSSNPVFGILINTLSVKNYMHILAHVQSLIASAGKKHYTFVVGKVNAAKVANFSEVGGWVVIGCWESSLIESGDFWKPLITPFELEIALQRDEERVWTGKWRADFESLLGRQEDRKKAKVEIGENGADDTGNAVGGEEGTEDPAGDYDSEEESAPPEFDLRTGRYVSHSRPMRSSAAPKAGNQVEGGPSAGATASTALTRRANGDLATVGGVVSPGAEYLRSNRTWQGLGSDYHEVVEEAETNNHAATMEEGRSGIARGYTVGEQGSKH